MAWASSVLRGVSEGRHYGKGVPPLCPGQHLRAAAYPGIAGKLDCGVLSHAKIHNTGNPTAMKYPCSRQGLHQALTRPWEAVAHGPDGPANLGDFRTVSIGVGGRGLPHVSAQA